MYTRSCRTDGIQTLGDHHVTHLVHSCRSHRSSHRWGRRQVTQQDQGAPSGSSSLLTSQHGIQPIRMLCSTASAPGLNANHTSHPPVTKLARPIEHMMTR